MAHGFQLFFQVSDHSLERVAVVDGIRLGVQSVRQLLIRLMCFGKLRLQSFQPLKKVQPAVASLPALGPWAHPPQPNGAPR